MNEQPQKLISEYHIDAEDRLIYIDETWQEFSRNNQAPELTSDSVLQKRLWDFIADKEVQHIYQILLGKVRQSGKVIQVSYRCDAPHVRRLLQLVMTPDVEGRVKFHSWLLREERRDAIKLLGLTSARSESFLTICSWCKRVQLDINSWVEVEEAVQRLKLFEVAELPKLSHGICPECAQAWLTDD